ncbi:PMT family glycosyltransferase, 4-amino-4-deoxy-L-arabinose transferase [Mizugakiibacter sediminis]|uniref:PMT family glycosyltransferase, 4-amino-4-deoxy-L-arabinose transferase n=1 Tax=Mizugakiibacter sediminis TaxID=1475481 RepID=A0A0K8QNG1_9GAMM|nr:glycosyltransferase family 39 protein [Mizugakiibacter sediminis]GAP66419.1 PMT family glycosyltransferase, 4-amino-4-deoxy-L-arabinose transferase [Mizugakiibacter sediminis]
MIRDAFVRHERLRALMPWLPLWLAVASFAIFQHGPMPLYSTRTLAVAWEMWHHHEFLVPHINGAPYSHKVPLLFWLIHAGWALFGVNDVWPRALEVLIGAAQLVLATALARRLFPERPWIARATPWMLMALSYAFLFDLQIMYEVLLAVWVLAALLCLAPRRDRGEPRWLPFALCVGAGLLTKGPVMLLHVAFPFLLGPLWSDWAAAHRRRWYAVGALALLGGFALLLAWALPAAQRGGAEYRHELFFLQTAGRVVEAFDHARPLWWYLPWLPVVLFPFSVWPRALVALATLRRPFESGLRFLLCWLLPLLLAFSLVSSKQTYYLLPAFGGAVMLVAVAIARLRERGGAAATSAWLGPWPLAAGGFALAAVLFALPAAVASGRIDVDRESLHWLKDLSTASAPFGVVFLLLGALLLVRGRGELRRLAFAGLIGTAAAGTLFSLTLYPAGFDLAPTARLLAHAEAQGRAIGNLGLYEGQYHWLGRLTRPIDRLYEGEALQDWARAHPDGLVVAYPSRLGADDLRYALLVQPFRSVWIVVWEARALAAERRGETPPEPRRPTDLQPAGYWRYRDMR